MTNTSRFPDAVDVAIIGSGPTGAAYARILSERSPGATIAMFEAGPSLSDTHGMHVKSIADPAARAAAQRKSEGTRPHTADLAGSAYADPAKRVVRAGTHLLPEGYQQAGEVGLPALAMSTNVGGMGVHWTGACPRPGESELIDFLPDLQELLDEGERLLGVDRHPFDDAPFADIVRDRLSAEFDPGRAPDRRVTPMPLAVRRLPDGELAWGGPDVVFGDAVRSNGNFTLYPLAQGRKVRVEDGRVTGVVIRDRRDDTDHEVTARFVVVAADAIRTPQLLWASGIRSAALGRYLNDQPQTVFAVRLRGVTPTTRVATSSPTPTVARAAADPSSGTSTAIGKNSGVTWIPYTDQDPFHGQVMQLDASPIPLVDADTPEPGTVVGLGWFCGKDLQASDRVAFDDDATDEFGMPRPRIHYTLTDHDHDILRRVKESVLRAARVLGDFIGDQPLTLAPGASLHYQGSTRMGAEDDGTSVCGPDSQVWGVAGLYVAGNNVIPTPIACNPTLTSVALSVAGARDIAARLDSGTDRSVTASSQAAR